MPHEAQYAVEDVRKIATKHNTSESNVWAVLSGSKTKSPRLAESIAQMMGTSPELYLVKKGVKVESIPEEKPAPEETFELTKEYAPTELCDFSDLDLLLFAREVGKLQLKIQIEMQRRTHASEEQGAEASYCDSGASS